jgi:IS605 OrfB family transposase
MPFTAETKRAYTLRLNGVNKKDNAWKEDLWKTHETVNEGSRIFGDLWLTLRGGLSAKLAETKEDSSTRRILLALSWLTVEAPADLIPPEYIIATAKQPRDEREIALVKVLKSILKSQGVKNISDWENDCKASLASDIKEDAVWVNRAQIFSDKKKSVGWNSNEAESFVFDMFGGQEAYFSLGVKEDKEADSKDFCQKAGNWLSTNWGSGVKSDKSLIIEKLSLITSLDLLSLKKKNSSAILVKIIKALEENYKPLDGEYKEGEDPKDTFSKISRIIGWKGSPSAGFRILEKMTNDTPVSAEMVEDLLIRIKKEIEDKQKKLGKPKIKWANKIKAEFESNVHFTFRGERDHQKEFSVLMDHALRRVSGCHSWVKIAEVSRRDFDADANKVSDKLISDWLDEYTDQRSSDSGALEGYFVRKNAIDGWDDVVKAWSELGKISTPEQRVYAVRALQGELEKFGDAQLFEELAKAKPEVIWFRSGKANPDLIKQEVSKRIALHNKTRFKVPTYRHPDPLLHPVFCDFGNSRWAIAYGAQDKVSSLNERDVFLTLWNGKEMTKTTLRWQSKRFFQEIVSCSKNQKGTPVSRNNPQALAASGVQGNSSIIINDLFDRKDWSGRLQADRAQLEKAVTLRKKGGAKFKKFIKEIKWFLTFSVPLKPSGPWIEYASQSSYLHQNRSDGKANKPLVNLGPKNERDEIRGLAYPLDHPEQTNLRKGMARMHLSRLEGLRTLSVDLGHRHAVATAVWLTLSIKSAINKFPWIDKAEFSSSKLFLQMEKDGKRFVFRRIGANKLQDGSIHPAPWAYLERQFFINLAGENSESRFATDTERLGVKKFETWLGYYTSEPRNSKRWKMDELFAELVKIARFGLARHAKIARISEGLVAKVRIISGDRTIPLDAVSRKEHITNLLEEYHLLVTSPNWKDDEGLKGWSQLTKGILADEELKISTQDSAPKKKLDKTLKEKIIRVSEKLIQDSSLCKKFSNTLKIRWEKDDDKWPEFIKWLSRSLMPRSVKDLKSSRQKGGLSLLRVTTIEDFRRKVQLAYFTRKKPDGQRATVGLDFASKALKVIEKLRENRVRQIASFITSSALGISMTNSLVRYEPCQAVVIEDLTNYRPEVTQTRRENRQLMQWSSGKIKKLLAEACQLSGLHLRQVSPKYTSRQDSRTGSPGIRCVEVSVEKLISAKRWQIAEQKAMERRAAGKAIASDFYLLSLLDRVRNKKLSGTVLIPQRGGEIFVSSNDNGPIALQADLNAAANIGLVALLDPDWSGRWWYVLASKKDHIVDVTGSSYFENSPKLSVLNDEKVESDHNKKSSDSGKSYHFRDLMLGKPNAGEWFDSFPKYEASFTLRVISRLEQKYGIQEETPF